MSVPEDLSELFFSGSAAGLAAKIQAVSASKVSVVINVCILSLRIRATTRGRGAKLPLEKILPPYKKLVTIIHDTGVGNLAPPKIFFAPLSLLCILH